MLTSKLIAKHSKKRKILSFLAASLCLLTTAGLYVQHSEAAVSSGSDYSIEVGDINTSLPEPTSPPKIIQKQLPLVQAPVPNNAPSPYTITATNDAFSFAISQTAIDFGALTATNPVIRTSDLQFSTPSYGAQILGYENHPLMNTEKTILPDTTCDTGTCSQSISSTWENNLTYGLGFRCESSSLEVCGQAFSGSNSFKQFADVSAKESPQPIALNQQAKPSTKTRVVYKVNVSGTQPTGGYSNIVTFLAVPNF